MGTKIKKDISLTLLMVLLLGCASQQTAEEQISGSNRISNLTIKIEPEEIILKIEGKLALTYTAEKQVLPMGVVLQFPDTQLELARRIYVPPENEIISSIKN